MTDCRLLEIMQGSTKPFSYNTDLSDPKNKSDSSVLLLKNLYLRFSQHNINIEGNTLHKDVLATS